MQSPAVLVCSSAYHDHHELYVYEVYVFDRHDVPSRGPSHGQRPACCR